MAQSWILNQQSNTPENQPDLVKVTPDTPVVEAIQRMSQTNSSCVVVETEQQLVGIFTERDIVKAIANGANLENVTIDQLMTLNAIAIAASETEDTFAVIKLFQQYQIRHLPVLNNSGEVSFVLTPTGILQALEMHPATLQQQLQQEIATRQRLQQSLAESQARFQKSAANVPGAIYELVKHADGSVEFEYMSAGCWEIHEVTPEQILENSQLTFDQIHPDDRPSFYAAASKSAENLSAFTYEWRIITPSGKLKWLWANSIPERRENGDIFWNGVVIDISDRKMVEAQLQQAKEAAESANSAKSSFLANMSHELRTPLNVILGFAQVMNRDPEATPTQRENLQTILKSGDHLLQLINNVLDLSKIEAGTITLDESIFDLYALLNSVKTMLQQRAAAKGLQLSVEISSQVPQYAIADANKLRQILLNILGNGIKFTRRGQVKLRVYPVNSIVAVQEDSQFSASCLLPSSHILKFEISDTGSGIAPAELENIFDAFVQARSGKISPDGTGLGLTISRKFVQLMGGDIFVSSTLTQGTQFDFFIPVGVTAGALVPITQSDTADATLRERRVVGLVPSQPNYRILVVDDEAENRRLVVKLLAPLGLEVREATNGLEAIDLAEQWHPDLIFMDIRMPILDGFETTRRLRLIQQQTPKAEVFSPIPKIIALTAYAFERDRLQALAVGCDDFLSKPFQESMLFEILAKYLKIQYIYEDSLSLPTTLFQENALLGGESLAAMPLTWIEELYQAARYCSDDAIFQLLQQVAPEHDLLVQRLRNYAYHCQFDRIVELVQAYREA